MSLAEIRGSPLARKMTVAPTYKQQYFRPKPPLSRLQRMFQVKPLTPIRVTVPSPQPKAGFIETAVAQSSAQDKAQYAALALAGLPGYFIAGMLRQTPGVVKTPNLASKGSPTITPLQQRALDYSRKIRMTDWINRNPAVQKYRTFLLSGVQAGSLYNQGKTIIDRNLLTDYQKELASNRNMVAALMGQNQALVEAQSAFYTDINTQMQQLQRDAMLGYTAQWNLENVTGKLTDYLSGATETASGGNGGGTNWKDLIILGALAIGGILILKYLLNRK